MIIHGPASGDYHTDLGVFPVTDWYYEAADTLVDHTMEKPAPPDGDNVLINGTNINPLNPSQGKYAEVTLQPNQRHLLRLINPSVENNFQVSLSGHNFTVIAADLVPVKPFTVDNVFLGVGQRYDVLIDALPEAKGAYWFNVTFSDTKLCGVSKNKAPAAIFRYAGTPEDEMPKVPGKKPVDSLCAETPATLNSVPIVKRKVDLTEFEFDDDNELIVDFTSPNKSKTVQWRVDASSMSINWDRPILEYVLEGNTSYPTKINLIDAEAKKDTWTYWVISNLSPLPHPMHLHGHDYLLLGRSEPLKAIQGATLTNFTEADIPTLKLDNPTRRDVTMLPGYGWMVLAFRADNPGAWLMHCHIAWHASGGLSFAFLERRDEIKIEDSDKSAFGDTCADWKKHYADTPWKQVDSGL